MNRDGFPHTVLGANASWGGYDNIQRSGGEVSYRFVSSGVYPYVCTYHPGMLGAVVVGDGKVDGATQSVLTNAGPVINADSTGTAIEQRVVPAPVPPRSWAPALWGIGLLLVVVGAAVSVRRRRVMEP